MAIPSGELYLLRNVPLTPAYEHTIDFVNKQVQYDYFRQFIKEVVVNERYSYFRKEREYIVVESPLSALDDINYMMFRSADGERLYYAFVTDKRFVNDITTSIYFQIDVLQTYAFDYQWKASYIKQAHVDRWTAGHKPIYSKTDEGLDYGTEYSVENGYRIQQSDSLRWLLVSMKDYSALDTSYVASAGNVNPAPSPFTCFLVPLVLSLKSDNTPRDVMYGSIPGMVAPKLATYNDLIKLMDTTAFGDYVQSISLLPYCPFPVSGLSFGGDDPIYVDISDVKLEYTSIKDSSGTSYSFFIIKSADLGILEGARTLAKTEWNTGLEDSLPTDEQWQEIKRKPYTTKRDKRFESKLLCAPYRYNLLTDWRNQPVIYKNEYLTDDYIEVLFSYGLSYNAPFRYWIKNYKKDIEGRNTTLSQPLALEFPIISEAYYSYMLQNKNTIQANLTNSVISAGTGIVSGAISGASAGGWVGAVVGAVGSGVSGALNVQGQIRSENAKQMDLKAKPDTVVNSADSSFNILDKNDCLSFYRMRICCENEEILAEIFNMTGYKVNRVEVPNTRSRTRFNYIQTMGANIVGSFNQADLLAIKEIYNKGITIWHFEGFDEPFNMLDYSYENIERSLL